MSLGASHLMDKTSRQNEEVEQTDVLDDLDLSDSLPQSTQSGPAGMLREGEPVLPEIADEDHDKALVPYDPLRRYLAEVRKYPFLSKEEELRLIADFQATCNRES